MSLSINRKAAVERMYRRKAKAESKAAGYSSNRSHSTFDFPKEQRNKLSNSFQPIRKQTKR